MKAYTVGVGIVVAGLAASANAINLYRFNGGYGGIHFTGTHLQGGSVAPPFANSTAGAAQVLPSGMSKIAARDVISDLPATSLSAAAGLSGDVDGPIVAVGGDESLVLYTPLGAASEAIHASLGADLATGDVDASASASGSGSVDLSGLTDTVLGAINGAVGPVDPAVGLGHDSVPGAVADSTRGLSNDIADSNRGPVDGLISPRGLSSLTDGSDSSIDVGIVESASLTIPAVIDLPAGISIPGLPLPTLFPLPTVISVPTGISIPGIPVLSDIPGISIPHGISIPGISLPTLIPAGVFPRGQYGVYGSTGAGYATATTYGYATSSTIRPSKMSLQPTIESAPHIKIVDNGLSMATSKTGLTTSTTTVTSFIIESQVETLYSYYSATPTPTEATDGPCTTGTTTITVTVVSTNALTSRSTVGKYTNVTVPVTSVRSASTFSTVGSIKVSSTDHSSSTAAPTSTISAGTASTAGVNAAFLAGFAALALFV